MPGSLQKHKLHAMGKKITTPATEDIPHPMLIQVLQTN
jgi:hypothetical protein